MEQEGPLHGQAGNCQRIFILQDVPIHVGSYLVIIIVVIIIFFTTNLLSSISSLLPPYRLFLRELPRPLVALNYNMIRCRQRTQSFGIGAGLSLKTSLLS